MWKRPVLVISEVVVVVVATVFLLTALGRVRLSVARRVRASVFNPQFAILEIGEFALLVVVLDLVPLSSGQIRRDSDPFLSE